MASSAARALAELRTTRLCASVNPDTLSAPAGSAWTSTSVPTGPPATSRLSARTPWGHTSASAHRDTLETPTLQGAGPRESAHPTWTAPWPRPAPTEGASTPAPREDAAPADPEPSVPWLTTRPCALVRLGPPETPGSSAGPSSAWRTMTAHQVIAKSNSIQFYSGWLLTRLGFKSRLLQTHFQCVRQ